MCRSAHALLARSTRLVALSSLVCSLAACGDTPVGPTAAIESLTLESATVAGGGSTRGTVTLTAAISQTVTFTLSSNSPSAVASPATLQIPANQRTGSFSVSTPAVTGPMNVTLTASSDKSGSRTAALSIVPQAVASIDVSPEPVVGGNPITITIRLVGASDSATNVTLVAEDPTALLSGVPPTVSIPAGTASAAVTASTRAVSQLAGVRIAASFANSSLAVPVNIQPTSSGLLVLDASPQLAQGFDLLLNTDRNLTNWLSPVPGQGFRAAYPSDQSFGFVAIVLGGNTNPGSRPGRDLSPFRELQVDLRGENGGEVVEIGIKDNTNADDGGEVKPRITLTPTWQAYTFPLSTFYRSDPRRVYVAFELVFDGRSARTVWFRDVRYVQ